MPSRHGRRRPERNDEAEIDRVPDQAIQPRRLELHRRDRASGKIADHLRQAEQFEMADQERAVENDQPAQRHAAHGEIGEQRIFDVPDNGRDRAPLPKQQHQHEARHQHICAALDRGRREPREQPLEALPRHPAVLNGEQREQREIDADRAERRGLGAGVDRLRHHQARDEADGIEKGAEKNQVGHDAVTQGQCPHCKTSKCPVGALPPFDHRGHGVLPFRLKSCSEIRARHAADHAATNAALLRLPDMRKPARI